MPKSSATIIIPKNLFSSEKQDREIRGQKD
jgi:hypothetical protein